jgi:hypothetical protein
VPPLVDRSTMQHPARQLSKKRSFTKSVTARIDNLSNVKNGGEVRVAGLGRAAPSLPASRAAPPLRAAPMRSTTAAVAGRARRVWSHAGATSSLTTVCMMQLAAAACSCGSRRGDRHTPRACL